MVYLYYCDACERGDHTNCERSSGCEKGHYGGRMCRCACHGDPLWNSPTKIHNELMEQLKNIEQFEKDSENVSKNLRISKS